jgi:hypothetical protein
MIPKTKTQNKNLFFVGNFWFDVMETLKSHEFFKNRQKEED